MKFNFSVRNIENSTQAIVIDMGEMAIVDSFTYLDVGLGPCVFHIFPFLDKQKNEIRFMVYHRPPRVYADSEYIDPLEELNNFYDLRDEISPGAAVAWVYNSMEGTAEEVYSNSFDKKYNNPLAACRKSECEV